MSISEAKANEIFNKIKDALKEKSWAEDANIDVLVRSKGNVDRKYYWGTKSEKGVLEKFSSLGAELAEDKTLSNEFDIVKANYLGLGDFVIVSKILTEEGGVTGVVAVSAELEEIQSNSAIKSLKGIVVIEDLKEIIESVL